MLTKFKINKKHTVYGRTAVPVGPKSFHISFNVLDGDDDPVGSAVVAVDLSGEEPATTVLFESTDYTVDYLRDASGWQCLLMRSSGVMEIRADGKPSQGVDKVPDDLIRLAPLGDQAAAVCGDNGRIFKYKGGKFSKIKCDTGAEDPKYAEDLYSIHFSTPARGYAVGSYGVVVVGDAAKGFEPLVKKGPSPFAVEGAPTDQRHKVTAVFETKAGDVLLGSDEGPAVVYHKGELTKLAGLPEEATVYAMAELKGKEYWATDGNELFTREGAKLKKVKGIGGYRMVANDDLMVVTCGGEFYVFDGQDWDRFEVGAGKHLVERLELDI
jgi:hypothetical protein